MPIMKKDDHGSCRVGNSVTDSVQYDSHTMRTIKVFRMQSVSLYLKTHIL